MLAAGVALAATPLLGRELALQVASFITMGFSIGTKGGEIAQTRLLLKNRDARNLSGFRYTTNVSSYAAWVVYGIVVGDIVVIVSQSPGAILTGINKVLIEIFQRELKDFKKHKASRGSGISSRPSRLSNKWTSGCDQCAVTLATEWPRKCEYCVGCLHAIIRRRYLTGEPKRDEYGWIDGLAFCDVCQLNLHLKFSPDVLGGCIGAGKFLYYFIEGEVALRITKTLKAREWWEAYFRAELAKLGEEEASPVLYDYGIGIHSVEVAKGVQQRFLVIWVPALPDKSRIHDDRDITR